jgi:glycosyltransferase involved in cell wall biosynthesis
MIAVSVQICAKNASESLKPCLEALSAFDEVIVIDSNSADNTKEICTHYNVSYIPYEWNGAYPKKRQWVLDTVPTKHNYIFFVDVDEVVTPELIDEIKTLYFSAAGYFVKGQYCLGTQLLHHGLKNNKLVLFHKDKIEFSVIDDLGNA